MNRNVLTILNPSYGTLISSCNTGSLQYGGIHHTGGLSPKELQRELGGGGHEKHYNASE